MHRLDLFMSSEISAWKFNKGFVVNFVSWFVQGVDRHMLESVFLGCRWIGRKGQGLLKTRKKFALPERDIDCKQWRRFKWSRIDSLYHELDGYVSRCSPGVTNNRLPFKHGRQWLCLFLYHHAVQFTQCGAFTRADVNRHQKSFALQDRLFRNGF